MTRPADLIHSIAEQLAERQFPSPGADARLLVAHAAGVDVSRLLTMWELEETIVAAANAALQRRLRGEPVQHITGEAYFRYESVAVGPGVFIPRPETELLAGWAVDWLTARPLDERRVVELCAGSGAVTRSLLTEVRGVQSYANERSDAAASYLRRNLAGQQVVIEIGDLVDAFPDLNQRVDLVVVNPPYVPERLRSSLPADVIDRDPDEALFAGQDGLDVIRAVVDVALRLLRPGGALAVEHDDSHQPEVLALLEEAGFEEIVGHADLADRPRYATAVRGHGRRGVAR